MAMKTTLAPVFERFAGKLTAAYLFGSVACGSAGPLSDIDLAVLLPTDDLGVCTDLRLELYADCCRVLKRNDIDIVLLNRTKNLFFWPM